MGIIQERLEAGGGRWTANWPHLGTGPVNYEDCISPQFFADEREGVFKRKWLYVGRVEQLPKVGSYFTREIPGVMSIVVVKDHDGTVRALHNVCPHRGNKVMWHEHPEPEVAGHTRELACKYHGWRFGLDGKLARASNAEHFFGLDDYDVRMPPVRCEVFAGFIFVNAAAEGESLREFLGETVWALEAYPFHLMTQRHSYSARVRGNWKLAADTICEWYHPPYVHGKFINPDVRQAEQLVPPIDSYYYDLFGSHMLDSVPGPPLNPGAATRDPGEPAHNQKWIFRLFHGGLFGPELFGDIGDLPECINPAGVAPWGNDQYWLLPNLSLQIWSRNFYMTYSYIPIAADEHVYNIDLYYTPPRNASELLAQELSTQTIIEVATQDVNTVEATHRGIASGAIKEFHIGDQELMIRNLHHVINGWVADYRAERRAEQDRG